MEFHSSNFARPGVTYEKTKLGEQPRGRSVYLERDLDRLRYRSLSGVRSAMTLFLAVVLLLLNVADVEFTRVALSIGVQEANPLAAWVISALGVNGLYILKMPVCLSVVAYAILAHRVPVLITLALAGAIGVYLTLLAYHLENLL